MNIFNLLILLNQSPQNSVFGNLSQNYVIPQYGPITEKDPFLYSKKAPDRGSLKLTLTETFYLIFSNPFN